MVTIQLSYPISFETAYLLSEAVEYNTRFLCVGRVMISYDPVHKRMLFRDGYGSPIHEIRLWHGVHCEDDFRRITIVSGSTEVAMDKK